ncbi:MAG: DUF805 domain-containing protein [Burkholderiales bacterium]|nr:DUF805 domain-containing protein [Burkholderiales bacterium]
MNWFMSALKKYAVFSGRSQRSEYWFYILIYMILYVVLSVIDAVLGLYSDHAQIGLLSGLLALGLFIPSIAVAARRLHDTGRTGWWQLIAFIPLIGIIVLIVFLATDSEPGANKYGPNPKGVDS